MRAPGGDGESYAVDKCITKLNLRLQLSLTHAGQCKSMRRHNILISARHVSKAPSGELEVLTRRESRQLQGMW
jgi:hypothetical protein